MTAPHSAPADPRRRLMIMVGIGVALGALLFFGGRVLSEGSGASDEDVATVAAPPSAAPATPVTAAAAAAPEAQAVAPVETFEVFTTKNPFIALRTTAAPGTGSTSTKPAAATAVPAVATGAPPAAAPVAAPVATSTAGSTGAASTGTAAGGQATEPTRSVIRVALLDVFAEGNRVVANVKVNDTVSKVGGGDSFASNFKVVSLDPGARCGRFLYGDDQFRLCKGEEILK